LNSAAGRGEEKSKTEFRHDIFVGIFRDAVRARARAGRKEKEEKEGEISSAFGTSGTFIPS